MILFCFVSLAEIPGRVTALLFLLLIGLSAGLVSIVSSAVIAETDGTNRVGQARSLSR